MKIAKDWLTVMFYEGDAVIEASLNYRTKAFNLTHSNNDMNVTFKNEKIEVAIDRAKCVMAALKYIKQELEL